MSNSEIFKEEFYCFFPIQYEETDGFYGDPVLDADILYITKFDNFDTEHLGTIKLSDVVKDVIEGFTYIDGSNKIDDENILILKSIQQSLQNSINIIQESIDKSKGVL